MKTVLIVDDEIAVLDMLTGLLEDEGYRVVTAGDGAAALKRLEQTHPDLILSDVMMPEMDGRELCHAVATNPTLADIPFVFLSASSPVTLGAGCRYKAFIAKPFNVDQLLVTVAQWSDSQAGQRPAAMR